MQRLIVFMCFLFLLRYTNAVLDHTTIRLRVFWDHELETLRLGASLCGEKLAQNPFKVPNSNKSWHCSSESFAPFQRLKSIVGFIDSDLSISLAHSLKTSRTIIKRITEYEHFQQESPLHERIHFGELNNLLEIYVNRWIDIDYLN